MLTIKQKMDYLISSIFRSLEKPICPYCGNTSFKIIKRKKIFTKLLDCNECHLYYRFPVEKIETNKKFYQSDYVEFDKITATLPSDSEINDLKMNGFSEGNKNADRYVNLFKKLFKAENTFSIKVIDYGCSWGYISYQFLKNGFDVQGFEISLPRAQFGINKLGVDIKSSEKELRGKNNIFFSSHVIEHHPNLKSMINLGLSLLDSNGYFIAISPNGSINREKIDPNYHQGWGKVHPNYLNADFYKKVFQKYDYIIGSTPFENFDFADFKVGQQIIGNLSGDELFIIARIKQK
jgi:hypothetical protein